MQGYRLTLLVAIPIGEKVNWWSGLFLLRYALDTFYKFNKIVVQSTIFFLFFLFFKIIRLPENILPIQPPDDYSIPSSPLNSVERGDITNETRNRQFRDELGKWKTGITFPPIK